MAGYRNAFRQEAGELLAEMEGALLGLAEEPRSAEWVDRLFRAVHTFKGSGAMFGYTAAVDLAHELETVLDRVRGGDLRVDRPLINLCLGVCDALRRLVDGGESDPESGPLREALRALAAEAASGSPSETEAVSGARTFRLRIHPAPDLLVNGTRPLLLLEELRALSSDRDAWEVRTDLERVPPLAALEPELCYFSWDIVLTTDRDADAVRDVFIFAEDRCRVSMVETDRHGRVRRREVFGHADAPDESDGSDFHADGSDFHAAESGPNGDGSDSASEPESPDFRSEAAEIRSAGRVSAEVSTIRVRTERLDTLVDRVGEMVAVQAGLSRLAGRVGEPELNRLAEAMERLAADLRDTAIRIRMTPLKIAFARLRRLVHDLSDALGKPVVLKTEGEETELDTSVIEGLADPMVHILRNCLDHGIESPEVRRAAGKPLEGRISVSARHAGGGVTVRIADDGAGIDAEAVRKRAVERGLLPPDARPDENTLFGFLFRAGFSTRSQADAISGRGVGLDVVRERVEALRGRIEVDSRPGEGTVFTLELPLTLAIIDGLLVRVAGVRYVLPLSGVESCMEDAGAGSDDADRDGLIRANGEAMARVSLRRLFRATGAPAAHGHLAIVRTAGRRVALAVDEVIGDRQIVIKSPGPVYRRARVFSGATVLDDGRVALILDPRRLLETAEAEQFREGEEAGTWLWPS